MLYPLPKAMGIFLALHFCTQASLRTKVERQNKFKRLVKGTTSQQYGGWDCTWPIFTSFRVSGLL